MPDDQSAIAAIIQLLTGQQKLTSPRGADAERYLAEEQFKRAVGGGMGGALPSPAQLGQLRGRGAMIREGEIPTQQNTQPFPRDPRSAVRPTETDPRSVVREGEYPSRPIADPSSVVRPNEFVQPEQLRGVLTNSAQQRLVSPRGEAQQQQQLFELLQMLQYMQKHGG